MNKQAKALLIPVAAFAVTVTGAQAFNSQVLEDAGLTDTQISAFEQAYELRKEGDRVGAREVIMDANIDMETMQSVREAMSEYRHEHRVAVHAAVEANDYDAFLDAIKDSPLADIITSEDDFKLFVEAHNLRAEGDHEAAREIMDDLGFEPKQGHGNGHGMRGDGDGGGERGSRGGGFRGNSEQ